MVIFDRTIKINPNAMSMIQTSPSVTKMDVWFIIKMPLNPGCPQSPFINGCPDSVHYHHAPCSLTHNQSRCIILISRFLWNISLFCWHWLAICVQMTFSSKFALLNEWNTSQQLFDQVNIVWGRIEPIDTTTMQLERVINYEFPEYNTNQAFCIYIMCMTCHQQLHLHSCNNNHITIRGITLQSWTIHYT